jgi:hypothetical protein
MYHPQVKAKIMSFFPNAAGAPRLSSPSKRSVSGFYTPYFSTFSFEGLFEAGEADFCVNQFELAWGWALTQVSPLVPLFNCVFRAENVASFAAKRINTGFATYTTLTTKQQNEQFASKLISWVDHG